MQLITHRPAMANQTLTIGGSYGTLQVCPQSGRVLSYQPEGDDPSYSDIVKFDLKELRDHYGEPEANRPQRWDILDVGFWYTDDTGQVDYCEPEWDWRQEILDTALGWDRLPRVIHLGGTIA